MLVRFNSQENTMKTSIAQSQILRQFLTITSIRLYTGPFSIQASELNVSTSNSSLSCIKPRTLNSRISQTWKTEARKEGNY